MDIVIKNNTNHKLFITIELKAYYTVQPDGGETRSVRLNDILDRSTMEIRIWDDIFGNTDPYKWKKGYEEYLKRKKWEKMVKEKFHDTIMEQEDVDIDVSFDRECEEKGGKVVVKDGKMLCVKE